MLNNGIYDVQPGRLATIVTHLVMREPAPERAIVPPSGLTLERANAPETEWYRDLFSRVGGHDWLWFSRLVMDEDRLAEILCDPNVQVHALMKDGRAEGLLELDFRVEGECELAFFGVTQALIGTGAGRWMMNEAIRRAWSAPISRFHVHTCTLDHPGALGFYLRSGFEPTRQQVEIADDPRVSGDFPASAGSHIPVFRPGELSSSGT